MTDQDDDRTDVGTGRDDAAAAFDRAAARVTRREWDPARSARSRFRESVRDFVLFALLLPAHILVAQRVSVLLILHLVVIAVLGSRVAGNWVEQRS